jgi:hypothetical protein
MTGNGEKRARLKPLLFAACVAFALEFAGCKEGAGGGATTEPAAGAAGETNSVSTNASLSVETNSTSVTTNQ